MKKLIAVVSLVIAISNIAAADVYVKSTSHSDPISVGGQVRPASDSVTEQWIGDGQFASIAAGSTTIVDLKKKMLFIVNHGAKTYVASTLPLNFADLMPAELAGLIQSMKTTVTVTPTGKKKTIGKRSCDEYDVTVTSTMPINVKIYASTDVPINLQEFEKLQDTMVKSQMMGIDDASMKEFRKIKGYQIATETSAEMMGVKIKTTTEVIEIINKPAPAGVYSVPAGYTRKDRLSMQDMTGMTGMTGR